MCKCIIKYLCDDKIKWIIYNCSDNILNDILENKLNMIRIDFCGMFCTFNQPIDSLSNYTQLQQLTFGEYFDQPIDALSNCTQLQLLTFDAYFNQPIDALANCTQLKQLTFGENFNQPIDALYNCTQLQQLTFGLQNIDIL